MSYAGAVTVIRAHLVAAGTALNPQVLDVARGAPAGVPHRIFRYWYAGTGPPVHYEGRQTLTTLMIGERIQLAYYAPVSDAAVMDSMDDELRAVTAQLYTRFLGDSRLGANCDDLDVGDAEVDYPVINGQQTAELLITLTLDFGEGYTISA